MNTIARGAPNDADVQRAALDSAKGMDAATLEIHTRRLKAFKDENGVGATEGKPFRATYSALTIRRCVKWLRFRKRRASL